MNAVRRSENLALATLLAVTAAWLPADRTIAADEAAGALKWRPHRASQSVVPPDEAAAPSGSDAAAAPPPAAADLPAAPQEPAELIPTGPATVSLPDGVPPVTAARPREPSTDRTRRQPARPRPPATGIPAAIGQLYDPANPDSVMGFTIMRTPRGPASRPILAPEGRQAVAMRAAADRAAGDEARLGGGIAPRYAGGRAAATRRPERLAMNVEGIPSVMTQGPQVGGLDDSGVPGRTPPGAGAGPLPTPAEPAGPAAAQQAPAAESIGPGIELPGDYGIEALGPEFGSDAGIEFDPGMAGPADEGGLLLGEYPSQLHVESFYDDPYACEDDEGLLPLCHHHGRICAFLRRFGKPYYGWRWYRDFTASAGVTAFTNATDLGINGNFGTNEYLNWAMPFWNAFGVGWQVGWRGTQTNFQPASIEVGGTTLSKNARDQQFVTTGFFTRAFEGRGLQGGAVYDYLHDSWLDNTDVSQLRYELSYVWGYHEFGFWGASNIGDQVGLFGPVTRTAGVASTMDLYTGFYRLQFGDANEWKVWGGGTGEGQGIVGTLVRAPMQRSLALEGTFTYVIPGSNQTIDFDGTGPASSFYPSAWNVAVNVVWYPAGRSRRSLASPYRPLFEVADNGSLIRTLQPSTP